jgi:oligoendopeptidase F
MFESLAARLAEFHTWSWEQIKPYADDLLERPLTAANVEQWLLDWTTLGNLIDEVYSRRSVATTLDTTDEAAVQAFHSYLAEVIEPAQMMDNQLNEKLLASGLEPKGFDIQLRNMRADAAIFREANVPLFTELQKIGTEYDQVVGAQTVMWEGEEKTLTQMKPFLQSDDRALRERVWRAINDRRLADRDALNAIWGRLLGLRLKIAANADQPTFRDYQWQAFKRFDYTPQDCETFHRAIEAVVVPAATRVYERQRQMLGVQTLRPWDLDRDDVYPPSRPPLHPFTDVADLDAKAEAIIQHVDPALGAYMGRMRRENLLDLANRKGKAPGGYQTYFPASRQPFIFMNAVGLHDDVQTMLHEAGHAFHAYEMQGLPYAQQTEITSEIAEVASMSMELLAAPYLEQKYGGYYSEADAAHARIEHLEKMLMFWPFMAVVDAFQHWVYTHPVEAADTARCDATWDDLWRRFIPGVDWSGLDDARVTGWHRKLHIFQIPFYYVDYGLAQVGAVQVWRNSLTDAPRAIQQYRQALSLGVTRPLPALFAAAGARFAFDEATMRDLVNLIEGTIDDLRAKV